MFRALLFVALQRVAVGAIIGHLLSLCGTPGALLSTIWLRFAECAAFAATCGIGMRRTLSLLVRASAGHPCVASSKVDGPGLSRHFASVFKLMHALHAVTRALASLTRRWRVAPATMRHA